MPLYLARNGVLMAHADRLLGLLDLSSSSVFFQPWSTGGALERALKERGKKLLGHMHGTPGAVAPRDMLLQPEFYRRMREYADSLDIIFVTAPVVLMDIALPLAYAFAEQAVFAWVPELYVRDYSLALGAFMADAGGEAGVVVVECAGSGGYVWLGVFKSASVKRRLMREVAS